MGIKPGRPGYLEWRERLVVPEGLRIGGIRRPLGTGDPGDELGADPVAHLHSLRSAWPLEALRERGRPEARRPSAEDWLRPYRGVSSPRKGGARRPRGSSVPRRPRAAR